MVLEDTMTNYKVLAMKKRTIQQLGLFCLATLTFVTAQAQQQFEGTGEGTVIETPGPFSGTPLLDGFYVRFGPPLGQSSHIDHHLKTLEVRPQRPEPGNVTVTYADKKADDPFAYIVSFHSRGDDGLVSGETGEGEEFVCALQCPFLLARPSPDHVFVLRGFKLSWDPFSGDDRHLERLAVFEADGILIVAMEQAGALSANDFEFQVDYAYLPPTAVRAGGALWGVTAGGVDQKEVPAGESVIRGFDFRFTNGDHHVREIGVQTPDDGRVEVFFNDKNSDDPFVWSVRWATLVPPVIPDA